MSQCLAETLPNGTDKASLAIWLKASGYARRLLLGPNDDPWLGASQYLNFFTQAQGLLHPDVAVVEVSDLYQSWLRRHPDLVEEIAAKRSTTYPLRKLLEVEGPRRLMVEVLEAVGATLRGQIPIVLALPAPRAFLNFVNRSIGRAKSNVDEDDLESAAMYMADFMRAVSNLPVGGLLLEDGPGEDAFLATDIEACSSLVNVAKHYRWALVVRLVDGGEPGVLAATSEVADAIITTADAGFPDGKAIGIDVGTALWVDGTLPPSDPWRFAFAEIPPDKNPEAVLDALARLRRQFHA
ncbi:MAG: hypothetical protein H6905_02995 [Hyphomicrobiales bacterium]|nr:hypothetical protein [Hyphomicrobiales bacterium]